MRTLLSRGFLRCFYCGQWSNLRFEGQKSFDCSKCDATNWLDRNGEITDPPATAAEGFGRNNVQYAISRSPPPRSPSPLASAAGGLVNDSIFCTACLRNQHMLNSALAQFEWPDAATDPNYSSRERKYWKLKRELEARYPQVCQDCLPKVNKKLNQASYTAQTDHLKRMVGRTRSQRATVKRRGILDAVDFVGELSWYAGFVLQAVWHLMVVSLLFTESYASAPEDGHWIPTSLALSIAQYGKSQQLPATSQLGAQLVIPLVMVQVYWKAKKSIHTDTTPLFRQPVGLTAGLHTASDERSTTKDPDDLSNILTEVLNSPTAQRNETTRTPVPQVTSHPAGLGFLTHGNSSGRSTAIPISQVTNGTTRLPQVGRPATHGDNDGDDDDDDDPMDWSPSASQHRAFSTYNPYKVKNINPRFSDVPTEPKPGPLWYKVPPAPTNPAQRLRNPSMRPIIREAPKEKKESFFRPTRQDAVASTNESQQDLATLSLAAPKFYAPEPKDDPRDGLLSLFENSFSLSPSPEEDRQGRRQNPQKTGASDFPIQGDTTIPNRTKTRIAELVALIAALLSWVFALGSEEHYRQSVALASICVCLIVSIRLAADLEVDHQIRGNTRPSVLTPSFSKVALVQVFAVILFMWKIWSGISVSPSSGTYGNTLFGSIIIHQLWHIFE
ncbi:hypothetical protein EKO27_g8765 [Xylaria grammica]|uniref:Ima1 N-terminal domain-containing protein n=1 Tax=Xylaria grammica TaxID=363999 RepID=A0A439CVV6_9PEZI|nr:hypothetical protein EKO27_g8765 [Xylaria grammica]